MLKQRILTASVLFLLFLITLSADSNWPFVLVLTVMCVLACWEWLRISIDNSKQSYAYKVAWFLLVLFIILQAGWLTSIDSLIQNILVPISVLFWLFVATYMVYQGQTHTKKNTALLSVAGVITSISLWYSLTTIFNKNGAWFLISLMALIWLADTSAYFAGKRLGKRKLAPKVSPGKTIEGAQGGIIAGVIWMIVTGFYENSFSYALVDKYGWILMIIISVFLAALSIVGDLFESLLKRRSKVKDSSNLLPGHGGVYDRIDALYPVAPLALILMS